MTIARICAGRAFFSEGEEAGSGVGSTSAATSEPRNANEMNQRKKRLTENALCEQSVDLSKAKWNRKAYNADDFFHRS